MPRRKGETIEQKTEAKVESPASLIEERNKLLDRIEQSMQELPRDEVLKVAGRVFEHSVEDGLKLADRLRMTPEEIAGEIDSLPFVAKHEELARNLNQIIKDEVKDAENKSHYFNRLKLCLNRFGEWEIGNDQKFSSTGSRSFDEQWSFEKEKKLPGLARDVDEFYSQFLKTREFKPVEDKDPRTKGERMAETVLGKIERAANETYYVGSVRKILGSVLHDLHQEGKILTLERELPNANFTTEEEVQNLCRKLKIDPKQIEEKLKVAKYTLPGSFATERIVTKQELSSELNSSLKPRGLRVVFNEKENKYEVRKTGVGQTEDAEQPKWYESTDPNDNLSFHHSFNTIDKIEFAGRTLHSESGQTTDRQKYLSLQDEHGTLYGPYFSEILRWGISDGKLIIEGLRFNPDRSTIIIFPPEQKVRSENLPKYEVKYSDRSDIPAFSSIQDLRFYSYKLNVYPEGNGYAIKDERGVQYGPIFSTVPEEVAWKVEDEDSNSLLEVYGNNLRGKGIIATIHPPEEKKTSDKIVPAAWISNKEASIEEDREDLVPIETTKFGVAFTVFGGQHLRIVKSGGAYLVKDLLGTQYGPDFLSIEGFKYKDDTLVIIGETISDGEAVVYIDSPEKKKSWVPEQKINSEKPYEIYLAQGYIESRSFTELSKSESINFAGHRLLIFNDGDAVVLKDENGTEYGPKLLSIKGYEIKDNKLYIEAINTLNVSVVVHINRPEQKKAAEKAPRYEMKTNAELGYIQEPAGWSFDNGKMYFIKQRENERGVTLADEYENVILDAPGVDWYLLGALYEVNNELFAGARDEGTEFFISRGGKKMSSEDFHQYSRRNNGHHLRQTIPGDGVVYFGKKVQGKRSSEGAFLADDEGIQYGPTWKSISGFVAREDGVLVISGHHNVDSDGNLSEAAVAYVYPPEKPEKIEGGLTEEEQAKLDLLNLVHNPQTTEQIAEYFELKSKIPSRNEIGPKEELKKILSQSKGVARTFTQMIKTAPGLFIDTITAKQDRMEALLARKVAEKMFPGQFKHKKDDYRGWSGYHGMEPVGERQIAGPEQYLDAAFGDSYEIVGGGREALSDDREIMTFRDPVHNLVIRGLFGSYAGGRWNKSYFSLTPEVSGLSTETTATLPKVRPDSEVILPKPLEAKIIRSRVKGLNKKGQEIALEISENSLGEATTRVPKGVEQVVYSLEIDPAILPMRNVTTEDYAKFKKRFGSEMSQEVARLPEELELFVQSIKTMIPKQQVIAIENFVRQVGYYDFDNDEVSSLKQGKPIEEQIYVMQERLEELRSRKPELAEELKGKQFAGVCADFAQLSISLLRRAGFVSGVARAFRPNGKVVQIRHAHSVAFVVWPDERGNNRVVTVDGTPGGSDPRMAGITLPGIAEREEMQAEEIDKMSEEMERQFKEILDTIDSGDNESIRMLQNGQLEQVLNAVLRHKVKQSHLEALKGMLEYFWYTPAGSMDPKNTDDRLAILRIMESGVKQIKESQVGMNDKPAGRELLEMMEDYAEKFVKGGKAKNYDMAYQNLDDLVELVKNSLNDTELKAAVAVIHYLRANKMKA